MLVEYNETTKQPEHIPPNYIMLILFDSTILLPYSSEKSKCEKSFKQNK